MKWVDDFFDALIHKRQRKSARPLGWASPKAVACWTCSISHTLPPDLRQAIASAEGFFTRHPNHIVDWFERPALAGLWTPNSDIKKAYGASTAYTITLTSLATSSTLLTGRESTAISNASNLYDNYSIGGRITMGSSVPTVNKTIEVSTFASVNDTPTYPDVLDGTDSDETFPSANVKASIVKVVERIFVDATANRVYWFGPMGIKQHFVGETPKDHGIFVTQDSGQALSATAGDHVLEYKGHYYTVI